MRKEFVRLNQTVGSEDGPKWSFGMEMLPLCRHRRLGCQKTASRHPVPAPKWILAAYTRCSPSRGFVDTLFSPVISNCLLLEKGWNRHRLPALSLGWVSITKYRLQLDKVSGFLHCLFSVLTGEAQLHMLPRIWLRYTAGVSI